MESTKLKRPKHKGSPKLFENPMHVDKKKFSEC